MAHIAARREEEVVLGDVRIAGQQRAGYGVAGEDEEEAAEGVGEDEDGGGERWRAEGGERGGRWGEEGELRVDEGAGCEEGGVGAD